jgi:hypothetical protein
MGGRPVAIYLLVNVLSIYADDADDVDDVDSVDDVDDVDDVGDVGDADLAKTLLPTDGLYSVEGEMFDDPFSAVCALLIVLRQSSLVILLSKSAEKEE